MIVDDHVHIYEAGVGGPFHLPASADDVVRHMDVTGVDASIIIPLPGVASNDFVHKECERHRGRLFPIYTPEFDVPSETLARMERFLSQRRVVGVKIHPRLQGVNVDDTLVREAIAAAIARDLPIVFDVFPHGDTLGDERLWPMAYHRLALAFPNGKFVLAHAGGFRAMDAFMVAKSNANVLIDISFTLLYLRNSSAALDVAFLCERLAPGKVLYGSDFPAVRFDDYLNTARQITARLSDEARASLFGDASKILYRLDTSAHG